MPRSSYSDPRGLEAIAKAGVQAKSSLQDAEALLAKLIYRMNQGETTVAKVPIRDAIQKQAETVVRLRARASGDKTYREQDSGRGFITFPSERPGRVTYANNQWNPAEAVVREFEDKHQAKSTPQVVVESVKKTFGLDQPGGTMNLAGGVAVPGAAVGKTLKEMKKLKQYASAASKAHKTWTETQDIMETMVALGDDAGRVFRAMVGEGKQAGGAAAKTGKTAARTADAVDDVGKTVEAAVEPPKTLLQKGGEALESAGKKLQGNAETPPTPKKGGGVLGWIGRRFKEHPIATTVEGGALLTLGGPALKEFAQNRGVYPAEKPSPEQLKGMYEDAKAAGYSKDQVDRAVGRERTRSGIDKWEDRFWEKGAEAQMVKSQEDLSREAQMETFRRNQAIEGPKTRMDAVNTAFSSIQQIQQAKEQQRLDALKTMIAPYAAYQEARQRAKLMALQGQ